MKFYRALIISFGLIIFSGCFADSIWPTHIVRDQLDNQKVTELTTKENEEKSAKIWHLSLEDYQQYQEIMQSSPSMIWYKKLDPAEVLGLNATSVQAREKYALIEAKLSISRVTKELAFQRSYIQAVKSLLPGIKPIEWSRKSSLAALELNKFEAKK